jgi:hypothetical protein
MANGKKCSRETLKITLKLLLFDTSSTPNYEGS